MSATATTLKPLDFDSFDLNSSILRALKAMGHSIPSAIQAEALPALLAGQDVLGQAATGTGKTAAFALPALSLVDTKKAKPQILVLTPTRELAIQVAEAFENYGKYINGLKVLPIYGGQGYGHQLKTLAKGAHVIIGTPGRVMDHLRRKTLILDQLEMLVLDEADEMLRMGFVDDVDWILEHTPKDRQTALFSATMPKEVLKIARSNMNSPTEIKIKADIKTPTKIRQKYWHVNGLHKLDALTRILETTAFDAMIVFARTKSATTELANNLKDRGYNAVPLNGDVVQRQREKIILDIKSGKIDIIIATDVAARGIDVNRITHVINFDMPSDVESYIHRIGRTGRAGREGDAISFMSSRERYMLRAIEKITNQKLIEIQIPKIREVNVQRVNKFKDKITSGLDNKKNIEFYKDILDQYRKDTNLDYHTIAASLANMLQGQEPLLIEETKAPKSDHNKGRERGERRDRRKKNDYSRDNVKRVEFRKKSSADKSKHKSKSKAKAKTNKRTS